MGRNCLVRVKVVHPSVLLLGGWDAKRSWKRMSDRLLALPHRCDHQARHFKADVIVIVEHITHHNDHRVHQACTRRTVMNRQIAGSPSSNIYPRNQGRNCRMFVGQLSLGALSNT